MVYKFKSLFDREKLHMIITDEPLHLYNNFILSIRKVNDDIKSYSYDNIDCVLKYSNRGTLETKELDLDRENFNGYLMMIEKFKSRNCKSMGEPIEIVNDKVKETYKEITLDKADNETKLAFNKFIDDSNIMELLFKCFMGGIHYEKTKDVQI